jgi:hypothetical protein
MLDNEKSYFKKRKENSHITETNRNFYVLLATIGIGIFFLFQKGKSKKQRQKRHAKMVERETQEGQHDIGHR